VSPHETIARMRAYQEALEKIRIDIQEEQHREANTDRIDELAQSLKKQRPRLTVEELEQGAIELNDSMLAVLTKYADEIGRLHAQLQNIIEHPSLMQYAARDRLVQFSRLRTILRRALYRYSLEFGWLLTKTTEEDCPQELHMRMQDLLHRIAEFSRALHFHVGAVYRPLSINTVFADSDPM